MLTSLRFNPIILQKSLWFPCPIAAWFPFCVISIPHARSHTWYPTPTTPPYSRFAIKPLIIPPGPKNSTVELYLNKNYITSRTVCPSYKYHFLSVWPEGKLLTATDALLFNTIIKAPVYYKPDTAYYLKPWDEPRITIHMIHIHVIVLHTEPLS